MKMCKCCVTALVSYNTAPQHPTLCKDCYRDVQWYKTHTIDLEAQSAQNLKRLGEIEVKLNASLLRGGYVPKWYVPTLLQCTCLYCGAAFYDSMDATMCPVCVDQENNYVFLHKKDHVSKVISAMDRLYTDKFNAGYKVPALYDKRKRRRYF